MSRTACNNFCARAFINIQRIIRAIGNAIRAEIIPLSVVRWLPDRFRGEEVPDSIVIQIDRTDYRSLLRALIDCLQNFMQPLRIEGGFTVRRHANKPRRGRVAQIRAQMRHACMRFLLRKRKREREREKESGRGGREGYKIYRAPRSARKFFFRLEVCMELARARVCV